jgi:hypothetical protein
LHRELRKGKQITNLSISVQLKTISATMKPISQTVKKGIQSVGKFPFG